MLISRGPLIALLVLVAVGVAVASWALTFSADFVYEVEQGNAGMTMAPGLAEVFGLAFVPLVLAIIAGGVTGTALGRGIARRQATGRGKLGLWPRMGLAVLLTLATLFGLLVLSLALVYAVVALLAPTHPGIELMSGWDAVRSALSVGALVIGVGLLVGTPAAIISSLVNPVADESTRLSPKRPTAD